MRTNHQQLAAHEEAGLSEPGSLRTGKPPNQEASEPGSLRTGKGTSLLVPISGLNPVAL